MAVNYISLNTQIIVVTFPTHSISDIQYASMSAISIKNKRKRNEKYEVAIM